MEPGRTAKAPRGIAFCRLREIGSDIEPEKTLVVTDEKILSLYGADFPKSPVVIVPEGETAKSWDSLAALYRRFVSLKVDRSWTILSIGGGSVSDVAGFAAHCWMRGVDLICSPTTLLAMTDAALGGKNGIDFEGYKNTLGSFHRPEAIYCDIDTLRSLSPEQFSSGMAEVIKHAVIDGEDYFAFLESSFSSYGSAGRFGHETCPASLLEALVVESQRIKLDIVESDPREKGNRRILNLGHSFGHAIESVTGMPHGWSVSLGLVLACGYSRSRGSMGERALTRIRDLLRSYGLPVDTSFLLKNGLLARVGDNLFMDKKREDDMMNFVLPRDIGSVTLEKIPVPDLKAFLNEASV